MGYRTSIEFAPLIGEKKYVDNFLKKNPEGNCLYEEYKGDYNRMCEDICKAYPGLTFIGYTIFDNTCGDISYHQIIFNKHGIIFYGPEYDEYSGENSLIFDLNIPCAIRGYTREDRYIDEETGLEKIETYNHFDQLESGYGTDTINIHYTLSASEETAELVEAIIEKYRQDIGITDEDYDMLCKNKLQSGYDSHCKLLMSSIYGGPKFTPDIKGFNKFQLSIIVKKMVSDIDKIMIDKLKETTDKIELLRFYEKINYKEIWDLHANRFKNKIGYWENVNYEDLPF